jgi:nitrate/TMAO reductase-like tetraheme cytochrome c subunit
MPLRKLTSPSSYALGLVLLCGAALGVVGVLGFDASMAATSSDEFCVSCHELEVNALAEFIGTPHHTNKTGIQVSCSGCHVPREFLPKMWRKIRAAGEIYHHLIGTIDTPEKYDAYRMTMARKTWAEMNANDSRQCRHCHDESAWNLELQREDARKYHTGSLAKGKTCIDCHKGLAHKLPPGIREDEQVKGIDF